MPPVMIGMAFWLIVMVEIVVFISFFAAVILENSVTPPKGKVRSLYKFYISMDIFTSYLGIGIFTSGSMFFTSRSSFCH